MRLNYQYTLSPDVNCYEYERPTTQLLMLKAQAPSEKGGKFKFKRVMIMNPYSFKQEKKLNSKQLYVIIGHRLKKLWLLLFFNIICMILEMHINNNVQYGL